MKIIKAKPNEKGEIILRLYGEDVKIEIEKPKKKKEIEDIEE